MCPGNARDTLSRLFSPFCVFFVSVMTFISPEVENGACNTCDVSSKVLLVHFNLPFECRSNAFGNKQIGTIGDCELSVHVRSDAHRKIPL